MSLFKEIERKLLYHPLSSGSGNWEYGYKSISGAEPNAQFLILHGNGGNAEQRLLLTGLLGPGYYFFHEYVGYGSLSHLQASKKAIIERAQEAVLSLVSSIPLYLVGESLGSGVACELAATCELPNLKGIALLTPYSTMAAMAQRAFPILGPLVLKDRYNCVHHLRDIRVSRGIPLRIAVVAGLQDKIIPAKQSIQVASAGLAKLIYYNGGHNDIYLASEEWVPGVRSHLGLDGQVEVRLLI